MSGTLLHHGHVRLINAASEHGSVVIGLTTDEEVLAHKGYRAELSYDERREILLALENVAEVVPTPWLISEELLDQYQIELLVHGDDNSNDISPGRLLILPRTAGVSSNELRERATAALVEQANHTLMLTPGPAAALYEHSAALRPVFGRGDDNYGAIAEAVDQWVREKSGQDEVITMQGSATMGLELAVRAFARGRCLLIDTGYYADRLAHFMPAGASLERVAYEELESTSGFCDWVLACYTETSCAFKADIEHLRAQADRLGAKLFLDATASIGLEEKHELADAMAFSSCKGLFGMTGAAFVAFKSGLEPEESANDYYFGLTTQRNHGVTGPYHAICSLYGVMSVHDKLLERVRASKKKTLELWSQYIADTSHQPLLCTYLEAQVEALDKDVVLYTPRSNLSGSVLCHLGEIWKDGVELDTRIKVIPHDRD